MPNYIAREVEKLADDLGIDRKRSIGEVAKELKVKTHVIRFWEENFPQIKPEIGAGKRRYYYNKQVKILKTIKKFLYEDGYTIAGLQKILRRRKSDDVNFEELDKLMFAESGEHKKSKKEPIVFTKKDEIDLDDFILDDEEQVEQSEGEILQNNNNSAGSKIDLDSRLFDFSNIKISKIDPALKQEIQTKITCIKSLLEEITSLKVS